MSETRSPARAKRLTYGGWRRPPSPGIGPLKLLPSAGLLVSVIVCLLVSMLTGSVLLAGGLFVVLAAATAPAVIPYRKRTVYAVLTARWRWRRAVRRGEHIYRSGLAGVTPGGTRTLPGLLAQVEAYSARDGAGRYFALLAYPRAGLWSVVFSVSPQGGALVDQRTVDDWVSAWGGFLAVLGQEGGVVQATATVSTSLDDGALLRAHTERLIVPTAPPFAAAAIRASATELPLNMTASTGWVSVTFSGPSLGIKANDAETAAVEIGRRLPGLTDALVFAGLRRVDPMPVNSVARLVREAFDPMAAAANAELDATGTPPITSWADCGPSGHEESGITYGHDSALSRTWEALEVPRGLVYDDLFARLAGPIPDAPRKRVTLIYRPVDAARTASVVDQDLKSSINRAGRRDLAHARDSADVRAAQQATTEEALGAGVTTFSVLVTVTSLHGDGTAGEDFARACAAVDRAGRSAKFRLSPVHGAQAAAFAGALGVGLSLEDSSVVLPVMRDHI
jgi:hypothetical protein